MVRALQHLEVLQMHLLIHPYLIPTTEQAEKGLKNIRISFSIWKRLLYCDAADSINNWQV